MKAQANGGMAHRALSLLLLASIGGGRLGPWLERPSSSAENEVVMD